MDILTFLNGEKYDEARALLDSIEKSPDGVPEIDYAEALESVGIVEFYNGEFDRSLMHLQKSLEFTNINKLRQQRRLSVIHLLIGSAMVRTGEINKGIDAFEQSHQLSRASNSFDLAAIASANQSIAYCKLKKFPKAIELCRQAMEITAKMNSMKCFEYLQYARTLVSIYIKAGDFVKAEKVLAEVEFSEAERCLLEAGLDFARGRIEKSLKSLQSFRNNEPSTSPTLAALIPPNMKDLKASYSSSTLLTPIEESLTPATTNPNSAAASRIHSRMHSRKGTIAFEDDLDDDKQATKSRRGSTTSSKGGDKIDEFSYGDEHLYMMENALPSYMKHVEQILNLIMIEYNKALLSQRGLVAVAAANTGSTKASNASLSIPHYTAPTSPLANGNNNGNLFQYPVKLMTDFLQSILEVKQKYQSNEVNPYIAIPHGDFHPTFIPQDYYLFPVVITMIMMIAQYEYEFLFDYYEKDGLNIETGRVIRLGRPIIASDDKEGEGKEGGLNEPIGEKILPEEKDQSGNDDDRLKTMENNFLQTMSLFESFQSLIPSSITADNKGTTEEEDNLQFPSNHVIHQLNDSPNLSIAKEIVKNIQSFMSLRQLTSKKSDIAAPVTTAPATAPAKNEAIPPISKRPLLANTSSSATKESAEILASHNIQIDLNTAKLLDQGKTGTSSNNPGTPADAGSNPPTTRGRTGGTGTSRNSVMRNSIAANRKSIKGSNPLSSSMNAGAGGNGGGAINAILLNPVANYPTNQYIPLIKDRLSHYSEVIYNLDCFGRDELSSWITYALTSLSGVSIGYLGQTVVDGHEVFSFLEQKFSTENKPSRPGTTATSASTTSPETIGFLTEVRNRLLEIETKLTLSPLLFYDYNIDLLHQSPFQSNNNPTNNTTSGGSGSSIIGKDGVMTSSNIMEDYQYIFFRILLLILLIKITVQLSMKQEINTYLITLEKLSKLLYQRYKVYSIEVIIYYAITMKYRVEYEEWCLPYNEYNTLSSNYYRSNGLQPLHILPISPNEYLNTLCFTILPWNKKYYKISTESGSAFFKKDAIKKLINLYLMISSLPVNTTQMLMESTSSTSSVSSSPSHHHLPPATMQELISLEESLIDEYESSNALWIYRFSKLRAMQFMHKMKEVSKEGLSGGAHTHGVNTNSHNSSHHSFSSKGQ